jgi:hypothetical protein
MALLSRSTPYLVQLAEVAAIASAMAAQPWQRMHNMKSSRGSSWARLPACSQTDAEPPAMYNYLFVSAAPRRDNSFAGALGVRSKTCLSMLLSLAVASTIGQLLVPGSSLCTEKDN